MLLLLVRARQGSGLRVLLRRLVPALVLRLVPALVLRRWAREWPG
jgi:hypothetical protein